MLVGVSAHWSVRNGMCALVCLRVYARGCVLACLIARVCVRVCARVQFRERLSAGACLN